MRRVTYHNKHNGGSSLISVECAGEQHAACSRYTLTSRQALVRCGCRCHAAGRIAVGRDLELRRKARSSADRQLRDELAAEFPAVA